MSNIADFYQENQNIHIPSLFLGLYQMTDYRQILSAISTIYENDFINIGIDTAVIYRNEELVGRALRELGIPRERVFLLSKVWDDKGGDYATQSLEESLQRLQVDYLDLFLLHWPCKGHFLHGWQEMERIYDTNKVRAVGVSNFKQKHLAQLAACSGLVPAVNQIECHPYFTRQGLIDDCQQRGILPQAWSPFMRGGDVLEDPVIVRIAQDHSKTAAQVIVRWNLQRGVSVVAKSASPERIRQNADVFDFVLTEKEMAAITALNRDLETGTDPDSVDW